MFLKDTEIKVIQSDITELKVDVIVNPANNELIMGGGLAGVIKKKGGEIIEEEAIKKGPIEIGEAIYTSAGRLLSKYVIHTATMGEDFKTDEKKIRDSCRNALKVAESLKVNSVSFPALGCGVGRFSYEAAAKIMSQEVFKHLHETKSKLKEIIFVLYNDEAFDIFNRTVFSYLEYICKKISFGPFLTVDTIIETDKGIVLIQRKNPPFGWALPGGFVDYGESLESAAIREAKEETNLDISDLIQFHTYSEPDRDPRFHTVSCVFIAKAKGTPKAASDAKDLATFDLEEIKDLEFAFDHKKILADYLESKRKRE